MNARSETALLQIAGSFTEELKLRVRALQDLGLSKDNSLIPKLKALFGRRRPGPELQAVNWDPEVGERVVDLHIIEALHRLGDDSEIHRIAALVAQARSEIWDISPDLTELITAVAVVGNIGRTEIISDLVGLTTDSNPNVVRNAVKTLTNLPLPHGPLEHDIFQLPHMSERVSFSAQTLRQEMETLVSLSRGSISLSPGVVSTIRSADYDRGSVHRENAALSEIFLGDMRWLDFEFFVEGDGVVICTYEEAGTRWREWWRKYAGDLVYSGEPANRFILRSELNCGVTK